MKILNSTFLLLAMLILPNSSVLAKDDPFLQIQNLMLFKQGMTHFKNQNYDQAEKLLNQFIKSRPDPRLEKVAVIKIEEIKRLKRGEALLSNSKNSTSRTGNPFLNKNGKLDKENFRKKRISSWDKKRAGELSIYTRLIDETRGKIKDADKSLDYKKALSLRNKLLLLYAMQLSLYNKNNDKKNVEKYLALKSTLLKEIVHAENRVIANNEQTIKAAKQKDDLASVIEELKLVAKISINRAIQFVGKGDYPHAENQYLNGIKWYEDIGQASDILRSKKLLAEMYEKQGSYDKARTLYQELIVLNNSSLAKRIDEIKQSSAENRKKYAKVKEDQQILNQTLGKKFQKEQAERDRKYQQTLDKMFGGLEQDPEKAQIKIAENREADFKNKLKAIDKILGKAHAVATNNQVIKPLNGTDAFSGIDQIIENFDRFLFNKDFAGGLEFSKKALNWAKNQQGDNFQAVNQIYLIVASLNKDMFFKTNNVDFLDSAENYYLKAIDKYEEKQPLSAIVYKPMLAYVYVLQKRYKLAEEIYQNAGKKGFLNDQYHAVELAKIAYMQGRNEVAEALIVNWLKTHDFATNTYQNTAIGAKYILSKVYHKMGHYEQSIVLLMDVLKYDNNYQNQAIWGMGSNTRQDFINFAQLDKNNLLLNTFSQTRTASSNSAALYYSLTRKGALLQQASAINMVAKNSKNPEIKKLVARIQLKQKQLANLSLARTNDKSAVNLLRAEIDQLEAEFSRKAQFKHRQTEVSSNQVIQALGGKQALVDFHVYRKIDESQVKSLDFWDKGVPEIDYQEEYLTALVADGEKIEWVDLGKLEPIADTIRQYRKRLNVVADQQYLLKISNKLYKQIWLPINSHIKNKQSVYLVPDGILHLLPFKSIQDENMQYLAKKHNLIILSSAKEIVLKPRIGQSSRSIIFASPLYQPEQETQLAQVEKKLTSNKNVARTMEGMRIIPFTPLPGTLKEGHAIKNLMDRFQHPAQLFTLREATEQNIKDVQNPKILHLATHGYFIEQINRKDVLSKANLSAQTILLSDPLLRSGLAFTNANISLQKREFGQGNDGILTALEVLKLNLLGTDLVTLSACETGVGEIKTGEGVYSLSRAFLEAGAKSVLSSLWSISDDGTEVFMKHFYQYYLNGDSAQAALQKTQLEFIHGSQWNHPFYWGAFVVTGKD